MHSKRIQCQFESDGGYVPYKDSEDQKEYAKRHYVKNKQLYKDRAAISNRKGIERNRTTVQNYKTINPCSDCGKHYHFSQMDFDHTSDDKFLNVSIMANNAYSPDKILAEMNKCDLVCANCHRLRTWKRINNAPLAQR